MSAIKARNTKLEISIFSALRRQNIYFQKHYVAGRINIDLAQPHLKRAVFLDGDFWHGYKFQGLKRRLSKQYWVEKIRLNILRDKRNRSRLKRQGWKVLRIWEHEVKNDFEKTVKKVIVFLK